MFVSYEILCMTLKTYTGLFSKAEVHGYFPLPKEPKIIAANHTLASDAFHLPLILDETTCFFLQNDIFDLPLVGMLLKLARQIPVQQNSLQCRDSITSAHTALAAGKTIVIFPEGELVPPGKSIRGRTGTVRLVLKADVPIIPLGMHVAPQNPRELMDNIYKLVSETRKELSCVSHTSLNLIPQ